MRKKIIAANWKMNMTAAESVSFMEDLELELKNFDGVEIVIIPPFTALPRVSELVSETPGVTLGAQNMWHEASGAFTGEVSAAMLREFFTRYVVLGHSERRTIFNETDELVNKKVKAAHAANLRPILCVGETLAERDAGTHHAVLSKQLKGSLAGLDKEQMLDTVIAYEPVWAIGTGRTATPAQAQEAHEFIRKTLAEIFDAGTAAKVRIQYGGSVKPDNAKELLHQKDIDGALVGGASLDPRSFAKIVKAGARG
ncbi:MAG: triose-phosphate isomerase [Chthoniobacterales bacterium]|nr:triose-phosphate isomerase [Chthoniobacterales bacterium]